MAILLQTLTVIESIRTALWPSQICCLPSITALFTLLIRPPSYFSVLFLIKMLSLVTLTALLASFAAAIPYPPEATVVPTKPDHPAFFGNKHGNFQKYNATLTPTKTLKTRAKGGVVTGGAQVTTINDNDGIGAGSDSYTMYWGDGSLGAGWPTKEQWVSFEDMFNANKAIMFSSCGWNGWGADDSGPEIGAIWDSIEQVATETNVDHRFILAIIIQESGGCVRVGRFLFFVILCPSGNHWTGLRLMRTQVPTTNYGVRNPGLMQCHNGDGTCHSDLTGQIQTPCPTGVVSSTPRCQRHSN